MTIAILPPGTTLEELAAVDRISPGLMSAGLGKVPPEQTYLDISQGNRIFDSLYDRELPELGYAGEAGPARVRGWAEVRERSRSAPADIVPGLLGSQVRIAAGDVGPAQLIAADPGGGVLLAGEQCRRCNRLVEVSQTRQLAGLAAALRGDDLLIAFERPPPDAGEALALGIAGRGFDGNLTSDSTRMDGYVLATDLAPTIFDRLGLPIPEEMTGEPVRAEGDPDPAAVTELGDRLSKIGDRRGTVLGVSILVWVLAATLAAAASRGAVAPPAFRLLALAVVYLPLTLLGGALLTPSTTGETLLVMLGAPLLGALTLVAAPGWRALGAACAATAVAYAADVIAGSPLTSLSLMGPNPALGVRFFGIGNELEAALAPIVLVGTGAALAGFAPRTGVSRMAVAFLAAGLLFAAIFAAGRFGADVGAAIVLPAGAAVAAAVLRPRRLALLLVLAVPIAALAVLALVDLVSGGGAHLTSSVLDAGGLGELADVAERRLRLSARSFGRAASGPFLPLVLAIAGLAVWQRRRLLALWSGPPLRAAFLGAAAAILVGTLANDSGALLLEVGTAYLLAMTGFAWAESRSKPRPPGLP